MTKSPAARDAYVQAEIATALAHQIRAIRLQRTWTQLDLAKKMGTTQAVVSRLEDPSYGRVSIKTLMDLARVFDTGLRVQFVSLVTMLHETYKPKIDLREVPSFEEEAPYVEFLKPIQHPSYHVSFEPVHNKSALSVLIPLDVPRSTFTVLTTTNTSHRGSSNYLSRALEVEI